MPMPTEFVTTAHIFRRNESLLAKAIEGLGAEQWTCRPQESCNCALWILGHMVWARSRALKLLGVTWTAPWPTSSAAQNRKTPRSIPHPLTS
jgi:hypothetical protein